eukprot:12925905-Prorocentrum_lima.AAC.1
MALSAQPRHTVMRRGHLMTCGDESCGKQTSADRVVTWEVSVCGGGVGGLVESGVAWRVVVVWCGVAWC